MRQVNYEILRYIFMHMHTNVDVWLRPTETKQASLHTQYFLSCNSNFFPYFNVYWFLDISKYNP